MVWQSFVWSLQGRLEEAESGCPRTVDVLEKVGVTPDVGACRKMLGLIRVEMDKPVPSDELDSFNGGLPEMLLFLRALACDSKPKEPNKYIDCRPICSEEMYQNECNP